MLAGIRTLDDLDVQGRRVFVRVDYNVPLEGGRVADDTRIRASLPTLLDLASRGARLVLASHLGRPGGRRRAEDSLEPVARRLAELLPAGEVVLAEDCIGDGARKVVADLRDGQVAMLENLRFHPGEEADDEGFARGLARLCDAYVNDAFGAAHRAHASVSALPKMVRDRAAGRLLVRELEALGRVRSDPARPFVAVLGGAKVSDKIGVLETLVARADVLLVGGAMANTFLRARGLCTGRSRVEEDRLPLARSLLQRAAERGTTVVLPVDVVVAASPEATEGRVVPVESIGADEMALDIGPATLEAFTVHVARAATVFWNGPMGVFERPPFAGGTLGLAQAIAACPGFTVVGGGESVAAVQQAGLSGRFGHVSTGGGASLELIEGRKLPGVEALR
ncbi:MAG: phosphoglycerate kinase [Myxococcota bacterium]|nr:phosphoglycerate kinase [Myxococcota bacterium]MDW8362440.1 phosphoglycerate kinase [Myxococcales bacterium]